MVKNDVTHPVLATGRYKNAHHQNTELNTRHGTRHGRGCDTALRNVSTPNKEDDF